MPSTTKVVTALQARMSDEQRKTILQAAEAGVLPSSGALKHIAMLECALTAVGVMLDEAEQEAELRSEPAVPATPRESGGTPMPTGTVKWFNATKGFGFIQPDSGGPDAFVHISAVERSGLNDLKEGQKLSYELVADQRSGKQSASNLKVVG